jgi:ketol-acid reductoisomerase
MKKVRITMTLTVLDETYEKEMMEMKNKILSGKFQREVIDSYSQKKHHNHTGIKKCTMTFEDIKL